VTFESSNLRSRDRLTALEHCKQKSRSWTVTFHLLGIQVREIKLRSKTRHRLLLVLCCWRAESVADITAMIVRTIRTFRKINVVMDTNASIVTSASACPKYAMEKSTATRDT
jgi:hypothetical protein